MYIKSAAFPEWDVAPVICFSTIFESSFQYVIGWNAEKSKGEKTMNIHECKICGFLYDPEQGSPTVGVYPGTMFDDLPKEWKCPICGAPKEDFEKK